MLKAGFSQSRSTFYISIVYLLMIGLAFVFDRMGILWLTLCLLLTCIILTKAVKLMAGARVGELYPFKLNRKLEKVNPFHPGHIKSREAV